TRGGVPPPPSEDRGRQRGYFLAVPADPSVTAPVHTAPPPAGEAAPALAPQAQTAPDAQSGDDSTASNEIDFGAILEQFEQEQTIFHPGELVDGTVVGISDRGVLVDFGYKSEGL